MARKIVGPTGSRRRHWLFLLCLVSAAAAAVIYVAGAGATLSTSPSGFEANDGNMVLDATTSNTNTDWNCFVGTDGFVNGPNGVSNSNVTQPSGCKVKTGAINAVDPNAGTANDVSWVSGQKMDLQCAKTTTGNNPAKDTFNNIAQYNETDASHNLFLYGASIRATANGSANENVELSQNAGTTACPINRTQGDKLLLINFSGNAIQPVQILTFYTTLPTGVSCFNTATHSAPCWANSQTVSAGFEGAVDKVGISAANNGMTGNDLVAGLFAEFGVNLTSVLGLSTTSCTTFGQETWESKSSPSFSANPEDIEIVPHTLSNCGSITIVKHTDPRNVNQNFSYTASGGSISPTSFKLNDRSAQTISSNSAGTTTSTITTSAATPFSNGDKVGVTISGSNSSPSIDGNYTASFTSSTTFTIPLSAAVTAGTAGSVTFNTQVYGNLLGGTTYTFNEPSVNGFSLESLTCTKNSTTDTTVVSGSTATIPLAAGDNWVCTYVNKPNTATLSTSASNTGTVTPGTAVNDTATVTGSNSSHTPGGSVSFSLCGPLQSASICSSGGTSVGSGTLSGSGTTATATSPDVNSTTALAPGLYCFGASWSGDTNYPGGASSTSSTGECFTVSKIDTSTVTTPNDGSGTTEHTITLGSTIYDTAVVTGTSVGGDPTGFVVFHVCTVATGNCSTGGTLLGSFTGVALVSDGVANTYTSSATSDGFKPTSTGRYCFRGDYLGSTVYNPSSDPPNTTATNECFTVTDTTSASSTQSWYPNDSGSVSADNGAKLNGTLSIQLYSNADCGKTESGGGAVNNSAVMNSTTLTNAASGTVSTSNTTYHVDASGSYSWLVTFSSTDGNVGSSTHCETTTLTINNSPTQ